MLVLVSAAATLITQRAVMANQTTPPEGQAAMIQKLMLVGIPASVLFSGFIFPLGVLLYWFTSNLWTMGQQFYILRFHPHTPGSASASAAAAGPASKAVAPKVGQKPINTKGSRSGVAPNVNLNKTGVTAATPQADSAGDAQPPGPANRPPRPNSNRPGAKRSPSKKRR